MKYRYKNNYTGEVYRNLFHAYTTIIVDIIKWPPCRTFKMFHISRIKDKR